MGSQRSVQVYPIFDLSSTVREWLSVKLSKFIHTYRQYRKAFAGNLETSFPRNFFPFRLVQRPVRVFPSAKVKFLVASRLPYIFMVAGGENAYEIPCWTAHMRF